MKLAPMRYKGFTWPHNPSVYTIDYERKMAVNKAPFGLYFLQDLGRTRRIMRGEGEFVGENAYASFGALANTFYEEGPGLLIHPLWQIANAYFVQLRLEQEPRPDYVRYSFEFWETSERYNAAANELSPNVPDSVLSDSSAHANPSASSNSHVFYRVVKGDTLWSIASRYHCTIAQLLQLNPSIKNPNLIFPNDEVRVK